MGCKAHDHSSGGDWNDTSGSFRIMWRDPSPDGERAVLKGYFYGQVPGGPGPAMEAQGT